MGHVLARGGGRLERATRLQAAKTFGGIIFASAAKLQATMERSEASGVTSTVFLSIERTT